MLFSRPLLIATLLVVAAVLLAACGGDDDSGAGTPPGGIDVPSETPEPSVASLPDTFPAEFPVYSGMTVIRGGDLGGRFIVEWRAMDSTADVVDFYLGALAAAPWSIQIESTEGAVTQIEFVGEEPVRFVGELAVAPIPDTGETRVVLSLLEY